jgi:integrase/recombinase XerD
MDSRNPVRFESGGGSLSGLSSGRRTFITNVAKKISAVGGSMRDVQSLAGHSNLQTTQRYIEVDTMSQRKVIDLI